MRRLASLLVSLGLWYASFAQGGAAPNGVQDITPRQLAALLGKVQVIDVNEADNYAFAHVPGAKLLAYDAIMAQDLPTDMARPLVFYCWSPECPAAGMASQTAINMGHTDVRCMTAGITGWQDAGLPTEP